MNGTDANGLIINEQQQHRFPTVMRCGYNEYGKYTIVLTYMGPDLVKIMTEHPNVYRTCREKFEDLAIQTVM